MAWSIAHDDKDHLWVHRGKCSCPGLRQIQTVVPDEPWSTTGRKSLRRCRAVEMFAVRSLTDNLTRRKHSDKLHLRWWQLLRKIFYNLCVITMPAALPFILQSFWSGQREDLTRPQLRGTRGSGHDSSAEELTVTTHRGRHVSRNFFRRTTGSGCA